MAEKKLDIVLIGAGNVAHSLAPALYECGHRIQQVFSRQLSNAQALSDKVQAQAINQLSQVQPHADLYLISVRDDAIQVVAQELSLANELVVHTSGSIDKDALNTCTNHSGVFYPLQTFSKLQVVDLQNVPFLVEASTPKDLALLDDLARKLSINVHHISSAQRKVLHVAAVMCANFSNHLYHQAQQILANNDISFEVLKPLILETALKVQTQMPYDAQTGPARRGDHNVMATHLSFLANEEQQKLYKLLTESIKKTYENEL